MSDTTPMNIPEGDGYQYARLPIDIPMPRGLSALAAHGWEFVCLDTDTEMALAHGVPIGVFRRDTSKWSPTGVKLNSVETNDVVLQRLDQILDVVRRMQSSPIIHLRSIEAPNPTFF